MKKVDMRCDHYWLVRRGGVCPYCRVEFPGNLEDPVETEGVDVRLKEEQPEG
jgi:hypothetical protein